MFKVSRPTEVVVLNCCVTETKDASRALRISTTWRNRSASGSAGRSVPVAASAENGRRPARVLASRRLVDCGLYALAGSAMR
jgi:hypothetical protein